MPALANGNIYEISATHMPEPLPETNAPTSAPVHSGFIFSNRAFLCLFFGSLAGKLGERLYQMAAIVAVMSAFADSRSSLAMITLSGVIPQFFLYPIIGKMVDSVDRRKLLWMTCALSALLVLSILPILSMDPKGTTFKAYWEWMLPCFFLLSLILVPFGPARASAIPDVVAAHHTSLAASIIATSGLVSILMGSIVGVVLAMIWSPAHVIPVSAGLYALAALLMRALPDNVAVPGTKRLTPAPEPTAPPEKAAVAASQGGVGTAPPSALGSFFAANWAGLKYAFGTKGCIALILFETTFWLCAVSYYNISDWHASLLLNIPDSARTLYFGLGLGCAGVGLFVGALSIGKYCRSLSPLLTFPLAYLLIGFAMWSIFSSSAPALPESKYNEYLERKLTRVVPEHLPADEKLKYTTLLAQVKEQPDRREKLATFAMHALPDDDRAELALLLHEYKATAENEIFVLRVEKLNAANASRAFWLFPYLFLLGLGGGMLLGRVDADMLAITDPAMRGRVFSIKGFFFTGALMGPLMLFTFDKSYDTALAVSFYIPCLLMYAFFPVFAMAWMLDVGIYANPKRLDLGGPIEKLVFRLARFIAWCIAKVYFRISIEGHAKVPDTGPVMLVANHGSFLDPVWLGISMQRRVQYIMHASYYYSAAHPFFRFMVCIPVDEASQIRALKEGAKALSQGICVGMFPEGTVTRDGEMGKPKMGALFLAQRAGATVVPCAIKGNTAAFPRWYKFPKPNKITILVGEPFTIPEKASREDVARLTDHAMAAIANMLGKNPPPSCMEDLKDRRRLKNDTP